MISSITVGTSRVHYSLVDASRIKGKEPEILIANAHPREGYDLRHGISREFGASVGVVHVTNSILRDVAERDLSLVILDTGFGNDPDHKVPQEYDIFGEAMAAACVLDRIRAIDKDVPVFVTTTVNSEYFRDYCNRRGVFAMFDKPNGVLDHGRMTPYLRGLLEDEPVLVGNSYIPQDVSFR